MAENELKIRYRSSVFSALLSLFAGALGSYLVIGVYIPSRDWIVLIFALILLALSLILGPVMLLQKWTGKAALILNKEGIANGKGMVLIRWDEVQSFSFKSIKGSRVLIIAVRNVDSLIGRNQGFRKYMYQVSKNFDSQEFALTSMNGLEITEAELAERIHERLRA